MSNHRLDRAALDYLLNPVNGWLDLLAVAVLARLKSETVKLIDRLAVEGVQVAKISELSSLIAQLDSQLWPDLVRLVEVLVDQRVQPIYLSAPVVPPPVPPEPVDLLAPPLSTSLGYTNSFNFDMPIGLTVLRVTWTAQGSPIEGWGLWDVQGPSSITPLAAGGDLSVAGSEMDSSNGLKVLSQNGPKLAIINVSPSYAITPTAGSWGRRYPVLTK